MTKIIYGIIGHPVKHSLSPAMHNAAFQSMGIDAEYRTYDVKPDSLESFLKDLKSNSISGINVTIPHKIKARDFISRYGSLDDNAERLGAVNTIKVTGEGLCGFNTDGPGFYRSLVEDLKFEPEGKNIFVLGAGGASHAIIMYLGNSPKRIIVSDIDDSKLSELEKHYKKYYDSGRLIVTGGRDAEKGIIESDLLVNATPVGMNESDQSPVSKSLLHPGLYVYDLVYNRPYTRLVKDAVSLKLNATTGLGMLLYQGAIAFEIWTGEKAPVAIMRRALKEGLKKRSEIMGS